MMRIKSAILPAAPYVGITFIFLLYILSMPVIMPEVIPCLKGIKDISYQYAECNAVYILDRYLMIMLAGFLPAMFFIFLIQKKRRYLTILLFGGVFSAAMIAGYYLYTPKAINTAANTAIILDQNNTSLFGIR